MRTADRCSGANRWSVHLLFFLCAAFAGCASKTSSIPPAAADSTNESSTLEGAVDYVTNVEIAGWARDKTKPDQALQVDIYDGSMHLATVTADVFRDDLAAKGRGNGKSGFSFATPPQLTDGKEHVIRVKVKGTDFELFGSPLSKTLKPK